jgi:magnesium-transporting ATPase (P-type)
VRRNNTWREILWRDIQVGDLVEVHQNDAIPADLLLIDSSNESGIAHVQTMNLDGETNTKFRKPAIEAQQAVRDFMGDPTIKPDLAIEADIPRSALDRFDAVLRSGTVTSPISIDNFLPRDASLKSTVWALGLVLYTGKDSKASLGLLGTKMKISWIDRATSWMVFVVILIQITLCLIAGGFSVYHTSNYGSKMWYVVEALREPWLEGFQNMLSFFLLLATMVPISLMVTIEIVKLLQTYLMEFDNQMKYEYIDPASGETIKIWQKCRTSTLNEDLGQVGIVFSDKTGTLTCNALEFKKCTLAGKEYGESGFANLELSNELLSLEKLA